MRAVRDAVGEGIRMTRRLTALPDEHGRHPKYKHLVWFDLEQHYGSYILTAEAHSGSALISEDDAIEMFGLDKEGRIRESGYLTDEYLQLLEDEPRANPTWARVFG